MSNKRFQLLILGNGYDLALGLPTTYADFMAYCEVLEVAHHRNTVGDCCLINAYSRLCFNPLSQNPLKKFSIDENASGENDGYIRLPLTSFKWFTEEFSKKNIWYHFFKHAEINLPNKNWLDFERNISNVILPLETKETIIGDNYIQIKDFNSSSEFNYSYADFNIFLDAFTSPGYAGKKIKDFKGDPLSLRDYLYSQLKEFTYAFNIYLYDVVQQLLPKFKNTKEPECLANLNPTFIINFNYTNSYELLHKSKLPTKGPHSQLNDRVFHIHGSCSEKNEDKKCNIVLGTFPGREKDEHTSYALFRKSIQRIRNKTGKTHISIYKSIDTQWDDYQISQRSGPEPTDEPIFEVHIYGQSLGEADKDVLAKFLEHDGTSLKIYCFKDDGQAIVNLIKLIGQDKIEEKINENPAKLSFITVDESGKIINQI